MESPGVCERQSPVGAEADEDVVDDNSSHDQDQDEIVSSKLEDSDEWESWNDQEETENGSSVHVDQDVQSIDFFADMQPMIKKTEKTDFSTHLLPSLQDGDGWDYEDVEI